MFPLVPGANHLVAPVRPPHGNVEQAAEPAAEEAFGASLEEFEVPAAPAAPAAPAVQPEAPKAPAVDFAALGFGPGN